MEVSINPIYLNRIMHTGEKNILKILYKYKNKTLLKVALTEIKRRYNFNFVSHMQV